MSVRLNLALAAVLSAQLASAADIAGIWKHAEEPGWIEIRMAEGVGTGTGTVVRNDVYPDHVVDVG